MPWTALLVGAALAGCSIPAPDVRAGEAIGEAVPAAGAIELRRDGGTLDQPGADPARLPLAEAIARALGSDPGLQAALARVQGARAAAEEAGLGLDPVLSLVLRFPEGGGPTQVEAGLASSLASLLRRPERAGAAHDRLRAEAARALGTALDVLQEVQTRYAAVQSLEALGAVLEQQHALAVRLHEVALARQAAGDGTRAQADALQAERLALEVEAAARRGELRLERLALARLVGEPSGAAAWTLDAALPREAELGDEAAWIAAALRSRPEVQAAEWELLALGGDLALAGGAAYEAGEAGLAAEKEDDWSFGPGLVLPLAASGRRRVLEEGAAAREVEGRHRLAQARRAAVEDVRAALAALRHAVAGLDTLRTELIPLLERRKAAVQRAFATHELDLTALLLVDQSLQEALARRCELERQVAQAAFRLERAVGGPASSASTRALSLAGSAGHE